MACAHGVRTIPTFELLLEMETNLVQQPQLATLSLRVLKANNISKRFPASLCESVCRFLKPKTNSSQSGGNRQNVYVESSIQRLPENRAKTKIVQNRTDPVWEEDFELGCVLLTDTVEFWVFDTGSDGKSDGCVGHAHAKVKEVLEYGTSVLTLKLSGMIGQPVGTLDVEMVVKNLGLVVTMHSACNLPNMDLTTMSDPYVIMYVDGKKSEYKRTATVHDDNNPTWDEALDMGFCNSNESLIIEVWDDDKWNGFGKPDDLIGRSTLNIGHLFVAKNAPNLTLMTNEGEKTDAEIKISLAVQGDTE